MRFLFFAYRDWAIDIFKNVVNDIDEFLLITNKESCNISFINSIRPDYIFFYGWSWMVKKEIVDYYTCLCLHPSKLPKYRGGSPIQNQIINGEKKSAVTIFEMSIGLDDGPICFQKEFSLEGYLPEILKNIELAGTDITKLFIETANVGKLKFVEQDHKNATTFKRLKPSNSEIKPDDFLKYDAEYFYNKVRSLQKPYPECFIKCKTGKIKLKNINYE